jgi:hypothetical protein
MKPGTRIELFEAVRIPSGEVICREHLGWVIRDEDPECFDAGRTVPRSLNKLIPWLKIFSIKVGVSTGNRTILSPTLRNLT